MSLSRFVYALMGVTESEISQSRQRRYIIQVFFVIVMTSLFPIYIFLTLVESDTLFTAASKANAGIIPLCLIIAIVLFLIQRLVLQSWSYAGFAVKTVTISIYVIICLVLSILTGIIFFTNDIKYNLLQKRADNTEKIITYLGYYKERDSLTNKYRVYRLTPDSALYYAKELRFLEEKINEVKKKNNLELQIQFIDTIRALLEIVKGNNFVLFVYLIFFFFYLGIYTLPLVLQFSMKEKAEEIKAEKRNSTTTQIELFSMIQHELGGKIPSLNRDVQDILASFRNSINSSGINLTTPIRIPLPGENNENIDTIEDVLIRMKDKIEYSSNALSNLNRIIKSSPSSFKPVKTKFLKFLQTEVLKHVDESNQLEIRFDGDESIELEIDRSQFAILIKNFISNAISHGFDGQAGPYFILFKLFKQKDEVFLDIINNGKPFPASFTIDEFKKPYHYSGSTGNTGLGGYIIDIILQNHSARLALVDKMGEDIEFKVCFEITFANNKKLI